MNKITPRVIPDEARKRLRLLFVARHAKWAGGLHPEDGNHALYHVETREILKGLGLDVRVENGFAALFERPDVATIHAHNAAHGCFVARIERP